MIPKTPAPLLAVNEADDRQPRQSSTKCFPPEAFRRHIFARLARDSWRHAIGEPGDTAVLREWLSLDRPLIVRRPCLSEDGREAFLGLALPGRCRHAFRLSVDAIRLLEPPPLWSGDAFAPFRAHLFGSRAWQSLTGLPYVTETSDIDLFIEINTAAAWNRFLARKFSPEGKGGVGQVRVDLEIIFCGDASFSWREYLGPSDEILIKSNQTVRLERKARLEDLLP